MSTNLKALIVCLVAGSVACQHIDYENDYERFKHYDDGQYREEYHEHVNDDAPPPPPSPYAYAYGAGRFPGHVDRVHNEQGDGTGAVRGSYSYVDPRNNVRTVEYVADEHGFQPSLSHPVVDTEAVAEARDAHLRLYAKIAEEHAQHRSAPGYYVDAHPKDTDEVAREKIKHLSLYDKIADEHSRASN